LLVKSQNALKEPGTTSYTKKTLWFAEVINQKKKNNQKDELEMEATESVVQRKLWDPKKRAHLEMGAPETHRS